MIKLITNLIWPISDAKNIRLKRTPKVRNPLGRLPSWVSSLDNSGTLTNVRKINRYLAYQEGRLERLREAKKFKKVIFLWCILLKNSKSYQLVLFHKVRKNWWGELTMGETLRLFKQCANKARRWDMALQLKRFYLDKGLEKTGVPNGKFRPIGSPSINSRFICKALNDLIYYAFEDRLMKFQHGFRRERGTHTALYSVWYDIWVKGNKFIYEFDFKSYFNKVRPEWIHTYLRIRSLELANLIINLVSNIRYVFDRPLERLPEEAEIRFMGKSNFRGIVKHQMVRSGVPQGLSLSPILATLVLELFKPPKGLHMYADDGLFISEMEEDTYKVWLRQIQTMGIRIAPEKSGRVNDSFKFLGVNFDITKETATFNESTISWLGKDCNSESVQQEVREWFTTVPQMYSKKPTNWFWEIKDRSFATRFRNNQNWRDWTMTILKGLWNCGQYKGYRYFLGKGTYSISGLSTQCCELLSSYVKDMRLAKLKGLTFELSKSKKYVHVNKKLYVENNDWITRLSIQEGVYVSKIATNKIPRATITTEIKEEVKSAPELKIRRIATNKYKFRGKKLPWLQTKVTHRRLMEIINVE